MEVTPILALKLFVSATATAGLINMYTVQILKRYYSSKFSSEASIEMNLRWASMLSPVRYILGDATIAFMKRRTLLFPVFELVLGDLVVLSLYLQGPNSSFIRTTLFLVIALPLAMISWHSRGSIAPNILTYSGTLVGLLASLIPGSIGLASSILGAAIGFGVFFVMAIIGNTLFGAGALGRGCVKTAMMIGAFCGFPLVLEALALIMLLGAAISLVLIISRVVSWSDSIPYVPFQVAGGVITMLWGLEIAAWFLTVAPTK